MSFAPPSSAIRRPSIPVTETAGWRCSLETVSSRIRSDRHLERAVMLWPPFGTRFTMARDTTMNAAFACVQRPLVCGLEAAWAFELCVPQGERIGSGRDHRSGGLHRRRSDPAITRLLERIDHPGRHTLTAESGLVPLIFSGWRASVQGCHRCLIQHSGGARALEPRQSLSSGPGSGPSEVPRGGRAAPRVVQALPRRRFVRFVQLSSGRVRIQVGSIPRFAQLFTRVLRHRTYRQLRLLLGR